MPPKPGRADAKPTYVPKQNATYVPKQKVTYVPKQNVTYVPKQNVTPKPNYSTQAVRQAYARPIPRQIMIPRQTVMRPVYRPPPSFTPR